MPSRAEFCYLEIPYLSQVCYMHHSSIIPYTMLPATVGQSNIIHVFVFTVDS